MRPFPIRRAGGALAAAFVLAGCGTNPPAQAGLSPEPTARSDSLAARIRADSARYPYTEADVRFMSAMIGHHSQAIVMARMAPGSGASAPVSTLAERIINGQRDEIATMQQWLRDRGKPVPDPASSLANGAHGARSGQAHSPSSGQASAEHHMLMLGMLTEAQLRQLEEAQGGEFDRLFLSFMIQHHRGAVSMVTELFGTRGAARDETVFKFANDVSVDQSTEIARMERMLAALEPETDPS